MNPLSNTFKNLQKLIHVSIKTEQQQLRDLIKNTLSEIGSNNADLNNACLSVCSAIRESNLSDEIKSRMIRRFIHKIMRDFIDKLADSIIDKSDGNREYDTLKMSISEFISLCDQLTQNINKNWVVIKRQQLLETLMLKEREIIINIVSLFFQSQNNTEENIMLDKFHNAIYQTSVFSEKAIEYGMMELRKLVNESNSKKLDALNQYNSKISNVSEQLNELEYATNVFRIKKRDEFKNSPLQNLVEFCKLYPSQESHNLKENSDEDLDDCFTVRF